MVQEVVLRAGSRGGRVARCAAPLGLGVLLVTLLAGQTAHPLDVSVNVQVALLLVLLSLLGLAYLAGRGHRIAPSPGVVIILAGLVASATVSTSLSAFPAVSLVRLGLYVGLVLAAILLYVDHRRRRSLSLFWWLVAVAVVHVPFSVHALVALGRLEESASPQIGVFWNVRHLGTAGMLAAMAAVGLVALDARHRVLGAVLAAVGLVDVVATGSRGAFLAWVCTVMIVMVLVRPRRAVAVVSAVAAATAVGVVVLLDRTGLLVTRNLLDRLDQGMGEDLNAVSSGRLDVWSASWQEVGRHPFFGGGPDAYWLNECCVTTVPHAHNLVLQALLEFGLVGCGLLLVALAWAMAPVGARALGEAVTATRQNAVLAAMIAGILALSMIDGAFYWTFPLVHLAVFVGLLAAGVSQTRRNDASGREPPRGHSSRPSENAASRSWEE